MWMKRGVVIWAGLAMALLSVNGAVAKEAATTETYRGQLLGSVPDGDNYEECAHWDNCQEMRGVSITDIDVSEVVSSDDDKAGYNLWDLSLTGYLTVWHLCKYDEQDGEMSLLHCDWDLYIPYNKGGELPAETDHVRIIVDQGVTPEYYFKVAT